MLSQKPLFWFDLNNMIPVHEWSTPEVGKEVSSRQPTPAVSTSERGAKPRARGCCAATDKSDKNQRSRPESEARRPGCVPALVR